MGEEDDGYDTGIEDYTGTKDLEFSHAGLVMASMRKCIELGAREMRAGYFNEKADKFGNLIRTYVEDSRKGFIEAVNIVDTMMSSDHDQTYLDAYNKLIENLSAEEKFLCDAEENDWKTASPILRKNRWNQGIFFRKGMLHPDSIFYQDYLNFKVDIYREILKELKKLSKRKKYYSQEEIITA